MNRPWIVAAVLLGGCNWIVPLSSGSGGGEATPAPLDLAVVGAARFRCRLWDTAGELKQEQSVDSACTLNIVDKSLRVGTTGRAATLHHVRVFETL